MYVCLRDMARAVINFLPLVRPRPLSNLEMSRVTLLSSALMCVSRVQNFDLGEVKNLEYKFQTQEYYIEGVVFFGPGANVEFENLCENFNLYGDII